MSSAYRDEFSEPGGWRSSHPGSNRGREDGDFRKDISSGGKGFSEERKSQESSNQRQDRSYGNQKKAITGRMYGFSNDLCEDDANDDADNLSGWEVNSSRNEVKSSHQRGVEEIETGFGNLSTEPGRGGRMFNTQYSREGSGYQNNKRASYGGGNDDDEGNWRSNGGRGGFRGGGRGFRSDGVNNGGWQNNDSENRRGRGGGFKMNNDDYDGDGRGGERSFSNRENKDEDGDQFESRRGRGGGRGGGRSFGFRENNEDQFESRRGRGGGRGGGRPFGNREDDGDEDRRREDGDDEKPREQYIPPAPAEDEETMFGNTISSGNNFNKYDNIPVKISGNNVPKAINSFEECNFQGLLLENIKKSGYTTPTPVQKHALPAISSGRDVMGCAQTGSGKTAAFLLPIIHTLLKNKMDLVVNEWVEPQVVICSPTRELALQIFNEARKFAFGSIIKVAIAYGGTAAYHQANIIAKGCHILVATPGRLNDFVGRGRIKFSSCRFFVLDEADRMLDMGFLPAIEQMLDHETMTPKGQRQSLMFSATFPDDIQRLAANYLHEYLFLAVGIVGGACADVEQNFHLVTKFEKKDKLIELLSVTPDKELTLVFVEKQRTADFIAAFLSENNFPTTSIHGARLQSQREQALSDFKYGRMPTLVATAVAARGLDIKNVAHVVNFDMPSSIEEYVHRIGRTGRVGNRGKATSFYDPDVDNHLIKGLTRILEQSGHEIPTFFNNASDKPTSGGGGGWGRRSQNFGGQDVRGGEDVYTAGPTVVHAEEEEVW